MQIRKIAPPAAGDQNLPPRLPIVFEHGNSPPVLPGHRRAHQPSRTGAQHNHIELARFVLHWIFVSRIDTGSHRAWHYGYEF